MISEMKPSSGIDVTQTFARCIEHVGECEIDHLEAGEHAPPIGGGQRVDQAIAGGRALRR
jgi:hypothetical protein